MIFNPAAVTTAAVLAVLAIAYAVWAETQPQQADDYPAPPQMEARLIVIDREAIEAAYRQQVVFLFQQWMKDDKDQPARARRGVNQARKAYVESMAAIDKREQK